MHVISGSYQQLAQEAATMCNRIHTFSVNNIYSIVCGFSSLANYFHQEHPAAYISYGCVTSATSYNVCVSFGVINVYRARKASVIKQHSFLWNNGSQESFIAWPSLQQGNWLWVCVASSILYYHMALAKYCYNYVKDKLVICAFIGRSFHQGIFSILFGAMKVYLFSLELSVPSPIAWRDEDQHLALVDFSAASKRSLLDHFLAVVVKDTVSMVLQITIVSARRLFIGGCFWAMFLIGAVAYIISQVPGWKPLDVLSVGQ
ncbi:predicted protein [Lichtheimia corymbifera JMRC:FSU:9682]|uniref:Uncharacterized protein n=1 Tax=Lichtheimia corymbifera JMRC:FSU:9682 TaxID=1263082 RepID=A0A068S8W2_9FUNG|nr:predicted protein [Lichtheimia corymbifera JMRC:FSU:9682]